ncbi:hypothetical protein JKP88DRAFT_262475, partial [Tribonema minus]
MAPDADDGLLQRQRSVSIDEVREQLRQGKPVHREATVAAGAQDYCTLMFGDHHGGSGGGGSGAAGAGAGAAATAAAAAP